MNPYEEGFRDAQRKAESLAGGMTGPGNTPDQCEGYSDACRDIKSAIQDMKPPEPDAACDHHICEAHVEIVNLTDTGRFSASVRVKCSTCGEPFRFLGLKAGLSPYEPLVSIEGLEARLPIEPEGKRSLSSHASFTVPPLPGGKES